MTVCLSCNRGQLYCGSDCSDAARKLGCAEAQTRYRQTERGKEKNREHQRAYRERMQTPRVSDQCSDPVSSPLEPSRTELAVPPAPVNPKEGVQNENQSEAKQPAVVLVEGKTCRLCGRMVTHLFSDDDWRVWRRQRRDKWLTQRQRPRSEGFSMSIT
jgi:hypothetical protein